MNDVAADPKEKLVHDLRAVIADAEELLQSTAGQAGEGAKEMRQRMQERLRQARSSLAQLQDTAVTKAKEAGHKADEFVHENPWKSIGAAAGIGLVVGLLIGRR